MSKQTDFNCCDLCHNLKIGDLVTIGLGTTTVIVGSVINRVCSNDCEHLIISAESLTVNGLTFAYGENGIPHGLCKAKKFIYVTTAGGPIFYNFGFEYVKTLATCFYGVSDVQLIKAEGLDVFGANVPKIMEDAKNSIKV